MRVVLSKDIRGLGKKNDIKEVSDGYARNFLLPRRLAETATPEKIARVQKEEAEAQAGRERLVRELRERAEKIKNIVLEFKLRTGEKGEVFGSVTAKEIEKKLRLLLSGHKIQSYKVLLEKPIKSLGGYEVGVDLGEGVAGVVHVKIEDEK